MQSTALAPRFGGKPELPEVCSFYETFVPHAEQIWTEHLNDLEKKEKGR